MKKKYIEPNIEICEFNMQESVLDVSGGLDGNLSPTPDPDEGEDMV